jgi:hypothetical protein
MKLLDVIRSTGGGKFVNALAARAGIQPGEAEEALRALLPEIGHAIRQTEESGSGAAAVSAAMHDERYARYLDDPDSLNEPAAVSDGERVLADVLDDDERDHLIRRVGGADRPERGGGAQNAFPGRNARHGGPRPEAARPLARGSLVRHAAGRPVRCPALNALAALFDPDEPSKDR